MNRLLSILLIPLFVLGHALPHSHAGSGMAEPDDHAARPHWHLFGGHSSDHCDHDQECHGHDHEGDVDSDGGDVLSTPDDHDSDAVYLTHADASLNRLSASKQIDTPISCGLVEFCGDCPNRTAFGFAKPLPDRPAELPIYLLIASLRL